MMDSAGGSAKLGRNKKFQGVLSLRGKGLNTETVKREHILKNQEYATLLSALECGFDSDYDESKLKYDKTIIMTDADVDGRHIQILLLTFFYRHMKPLVEGGHLYLAQPPLYKVYKENSTNKKNIIYCWNEEERLNAVQKLEKVKGKTKIQRYKGLGEMSEEQLWDTTMNPDTRLLYRITVEDALRADKLFSNLMGKNAEPRRKYLAEHVDFEDDE